MGNFTTYLQRINLKTGVWNFRNLSRLRCGPAGAVKLLYAVHKAIEYVSAFKDHEPPGHAKLFIIKVLEFARALKPGTVSDDRILAHLSAGLEKLTIGRINEIFSAGLTDPISTLAQEMGLHQASIQMPPTLTALGENRHTVTISFEVPERPAPPSLMPENTFVIPLTSDEEINPELIGAKSKGLMELHRAGIPIPHEGFSIITRAFDAFVEFHPEIRILIEEIEGISGNIVEHGLSTTGSKDALDKLEDALKVKCQLVQERIKNSPLPPNLERHLREKYRELSKSMAEPSVAIRSSAIAEDLSFASFAGQHDTFLNQVGWPQVRRSIRGCWASLFDWNRVVRYKNSARIVILTKLRTESEPARQAEMGQELALLKHTSAKLAVTLQRFVDADISGVGFSIHPTYGAKGIFLSSNFRLGESIVQQLASPDETFIFGPQGRHIQLTGAKEKAVFPRGVFDPHTSRAEDTGTSVLAVDREYREVFSLSMQHARRIQACIEKLLAFYRDKGQSVAALDTEFVVDRNQTVLFVQARPETVFSNRGGKQAMVSVIDAVPTSSRLTKAQKAILETPLVTGGIPGYPSVVTGKIRIHHISDNPTPDEIARIEADVDEDTILVINKTVPALLRVVEKVRGIITEIGGPTSHAAIVSREKAKPSIIGLANVRQLLWQKVGEEIILDAAACRVFRSDGKTTLPTKEVPLHEALMWLQSDDIIDRSIAQIRGEYTSTPETAYKPIPRPGNPMSILQHSMYKLAFSALHEKLQAYAQKHEIIFAADGLVTEKEDNDSAHNGINKRRLFTFRVWNERIARVLEKLSIEELAELFNERRDAAKAFAALVDKAELTSESAKNLFEAYEQMIVSFHLRWMFKQVVGIRTLEAKKGVGKSLERYYLDRVIDVFERQQENTRLAMERRKRELVASLSALVPFKDGQARNNQLIIDTLADLAERRDLDIEKLTGTARIIADMLRQFYEDFPSDLDIHDISREPGEKEGGAQAGVQVLAKDLSTKIDASNGTYPGEEEDFTPAFRGDLFAGKDEAIALAHLFALQSIQTENEHLWQPRDHFKMRLFLKRVGERLYGEGENHWLEVFNLSPSEVVAALKRKGL